MDHPKHQLLRYQVDKDYKEQFDKPRWQLVEELMSAEEKVFELRVLLLLLSVASLGLVAVVVVDVLL